MLSLVLELSEEEQDDVRFKQVKNHSGILFSPGIDVMLHKNSFSVRTGMYKNS